MDATQDQAQQSADAQWGRLLGAALLLAFTLLTVLAFTSGPKIDHFVRDPGLIGGGVSLPIRCGPAIQPGRAPQELDDSGHAHPLNVFTGVTRSEQADIAAHCRKATYGRLAVAVVLLLVVGAVWCHVVWLYVERRRPAPLDDRAPAEAV